LICGIRSGTIAAIPMMLWRLRAVTSSEIACSIEKAGDAYRLIVRRGDRIEHDERMEDVTTARARAALLRAQLLALGLTSAA
jgi:hypothetical protein